ncbi:hypothetical protein SAMN02799616_03940 [Paenibacillus sp. UNC499MF]|nr:hypothetical protein SAMN02799616_03940 [Paenibacillus sp. UNC499MF]
MRIKKKKRLPGLFGSLCFEQAGQGSFRKLGASGGVCFWGPALLRHVISNASDFPRRPLRRCTGAGRRPVQLHVTVTGEEPHVYALCTTVRVLAAFGRRGNGQWLRLGVSRSVTPAAFSLSSAGTAATARDLSKRHNAERPHFASSSRRSSVTASARVVRPCGAKTPGPRPCTSSFCWAAAM